MLIGTLNLNTKIIFVSDISSCHLLHGDGKRTNSGYTKFRGKREVRSVGLTADLVHLDRTELRTDRQTDRQTDNHKVDWRKDRQTDRQTRRLVDWRKDEQTEKTQTNGRTERHNHVE